MMDALTNRLRELSRAITEGSVEREFTMRVPAEPDRDADIVLVRAAAKIEDLSAQLTACQKDADFFQDQAHKLRVEREEAHALIEKMAEAMDTCDRLCIREALAAYRQWKEKQ